MKKIICTLSILISLVGASVSFANVDEFYALQGLTAAQRQQLSQAQFNYKTKNDELNNKIMSYYSKIGLIDKQLDKSAEEKALMRATYERNVETFKAQQDTLKKELDEAYKKVMTNEQYLQYQAQQMRVQNSFAQFLQK